MREGQRRNRARLILSAVAVSVAVGGGLAGWAFTQSERTTSPVPPVDTPSIEPSPGEEWAWRFLKPGPSWNQLSTPPDARTEAITVWSGRQSSGRDFILWGGYSGDDLTNDGFSWDAEINDWTPIAPSPLEPRAQAGAVYTGAEVVIWGGFDAGENALGDGAAYDPGSDTWRMLPEAPIDPAVPVATVWTGEEVIVWGSTVRSAGSKEGAAYNPETNEWRRLPDAPTVINEGSAVWAGGDPVRPLEMIVFGAELDDNRRSESDHAIGLSYSVGLDRWRVLPRVDLSPQASSIAWTGEELIAWDYALGAAEYDRALGEDDRAADEWRRLPDLPLEGGECYPESETIGRWIFAWYCGQAALWDFVEGGWDRIETPNRTVSGPPVAAGEVLIFAGAGPEPDSNALWVYVPAGAK